MSQDQSKGENIRLSRPDQPQHGARPRRFKVRTDASGLPLVPHHLLPLRAMTPAQKDEPARPATR